MQTRIMIVDDEEVTGRLLLYQLQGLGYAAVYVQDGLQALQQILIEQPSLILLDVMMPLISGWDVCREIRVCSSVPIIMLTGKDADDDVVVGLAAGADDYVTKPFNMAQLQARIEAVLRRAGQRSHWAVASTIRRSNTETTSGSMPLPRTAPQPQPCTMAVPQFVHSARVASAAIAQMVEPALQAPMPSPMYTNGTSTARAPEPMPAPIIMPRPTALGMRLHTARQARSISLYQAEQMCLIRWDYLQAIEQENWNYLPRPQLHNAIRQYAAFLRIDPGQTIRAPQRDWPIWQYTAIATAALAVVLLIVLLVLVWGRIV